MALNGFKPSDVETDLKRTVFCSSEEHNEDEVLNNCCKCFQGETGQDFFKHRHRHLVESCEEESVANGIQGAGMADIARLQEKSQRFEDGVRHIDQRSQDIERQLESLKRDIHQFVENLIVSLHQRKEELITKAEDQGKKSLKRLKNQKDQLLTGLRRLDTAILQTQSAARRNTDTESVHCKQDYKELIDKEMCLCPIENIHFGFRSSCEVLNAVEIGSVLIAQSCPGQSTVEGQGLSEAFAGLRTKFAVVTRNKTGDQVYCPGDHIAVNLKSLEDEDDVDTYIEDSKNGTYSVFYLAKQPGSYEVSVVLNGTSLIRGIPLEPITVAQRLFRPMFSIGQQGTNLGAFRKPWGIAVNEQDEIAVADLGNNRIQILTSEGEIIRCFGKGGSGPGEFSGPCDLSWGSGGEILVSDSGNHRIQIFTDTGKLIRTFGKEGNLSGDLCFPHGVSTDCHGNVIVADTGNKRIQIFSAEGQFKSTLGRGQDLCCPMSCIFINDHFVVSDFHDHHIKVFNREGHFLYEFGTKGEKPGDLNCPAGLAADRTGHLVVCDRGNCRVQLFNMDGTFRSEFGSSGNEAGQFLFPCSVGVLTNGRFVVSDLENGRLQIFE